LLGEEEARVKLVRQHRRRRVVALVDDLHQTIILLVEAVDDAGVVGVGEGLANRGQCVGERLDLAVEHSHRGVELLTFTKLTTDGGGASL
jgi:hypothetical protein